MPTYKQTITAADPQTVLAGLPLHADQSAEIVMPADESVTPAAPGKSGFEIMRVEHIVIPSRDELHER